MRPTGVVLIALYHFLSALFLVLFAIFLVLVEPSWLASFRLPDSARRPDWASA
jgi:hypothetical protein